VIDNFGDIGVCWRLARQLATEYGTHITLWVDDLTSFAILAPTLDPNAPLQRLAEITVRLWAAADVAQPTENIDVLIEGFGCRVSEHVIAAMNQQSTPPLWINLEYLTAEAWSIDCHGMQSTHPSTGLLQYFWFPGFVAASGGLLREADLITRRNAFVNDAQAQDEFWTRINVADAARYPRTLSLFSYENPQIPPLLDALAADDIASLILVPHSKALPQIAAWAKRPLTIGDHYAQGALTIVVLPFLSHDDYDRLLWLCDLNLVRGEDSLVRAHWAGKPLLWHIYPQAEDAHLTKLDAYLEATGSTTPSWISAMQQWNAHAPTLSSRAWSELLADLPEWTVDSQRWQAVLTAQSDLCLRLMAFITEKHHLPTSSR
jgi:uncharacterized repeat protein (TIGR03837 family)